jgi:hypothetical protein
MLIKPKTLVGFKLDSFDGENRSLEFYVLRSAFAGSDSWKAVVLFFESSGKFFRRVLQAEKKSLCLRAVAANFSR